VGAALTVHGDPGPTRYARERVAKTEKIVIDVGGREVTVSSPSKLYFPEAGVTKLDVVKYFVSVAEGALRGAGGRPNVLVRYVEGIKEQPFWQKRAPENRPEWLEVVSLSFPSGRTAEELVPREAAALAWMANLGCIELHPHPVRAEDLDHPDELRVDLDPMPGVEWPQIREVAMTVRATLADLGLEGWPKTSGSRGIHVLVRIRPEWGFQDVRRAALAMAREVERRVPKLATSKWWKEERHGVFIDYNQNAKDRTVCSAYSVRPRVDARVSAPVTWDELMDCQPEDFTLRTMPARFAAIGDRHAEIDRRPCSLEPLLELSRKDEASGLGDAPWPPHYQKQEGEPARVQPSRAKKWSPPRPREPGEPPPKTRRKSSKPLIEIARAEKKDEALAGLERWKSKHADIVPMLEATDVLVDAMRGRYTAWWRIRVNLEHVPEEKRPPQEALEVDWEPGDLRPVNAGGPSRKKKKTESESGSGSESGS
jgi:DNA ligase D-like protein (predicted polymerase)